MKTKLLGYFDKVHKPMTPLLPEVAFSKTLCLEGQGRLPIAIGAMLVTAWLSAATAAPLGADRQAPTKPPESVADIAPAFR